MNREKKRGLAASLLFCMLSLSPTPGEAVPIPGLFNTGVDSAGTPLAGGSADPHYRLEVSADPDFPGPIAFVPSPAGDGAWLPNTSTSKWIAPSEDQHLFTGTDHDAGDYTYRLEFDLAGLDPATAQISGQWAADNTGVIVLNGTGTGNVASGFGSFAAFSIVGGFVSGLNVLDFIVTNTPPSATTPNLTGLRVDNISGTAAVLAAMPEPQTLMLMALGLLGLWGFGQRTY